MIPFTKAHACGNDFLIVTEEAAHGRDLAELTRRLCARNTGIGADGIEFFAWTGPNSGRIRLHNADGSIAEISGNGTRCVAAWMALERGFHPGDELRIETDAGLRLCRVNSLKTDGEFTVEVTAGMGVPSFAPRTVTLANGIASCEASRSPPAIRTSSSWWKTQSLPLPARAGRRLARRFAATPIFPARQTSNFCASSLPLRSRFASSSAASGQLFLRHRNFGRGHGSDGLQRLPISAHRRCSRRRADRRVGRAWARNSCSLDPHR